MRTLPTPVYFYGMEPGQEISVEIDPGKTLEIRFQTVGETNADGEVRVFFELNGQPRTARVPNRKAQASAPRRPKAEAGNPAHVAAPMPGVIASIAVKEGQPVNPGDLLLSIEAMKMETGLHAEKAGVVKALHVTPGAQVDAKGLLVELDLGRASARRARGRSSRARPDPRMAGLLPRGPRPKPPPEKPPCQRGRTAWSMM